MKIFRLNLLLALTVAAFLVLWLLPLCALLLSRYLAWIALPLFGYVTWRIWQAYRAIPEALQPKSPPGMQLRESDAPELFAMGARVKAETGMNSVVECWCDVSPTISAVAYAEHVASEAKIALRNGIGALAVLTQAQVEVLLRYHLTILTFSPRLMSLALKGRLISASFFYFAPYVQLFNVSLRKVERYARGRAADIDETTAAIELSREVAVQFQLFWMTEMQLFLKTGNLMPIAEGFFQYWRRSHAEMEEKPAIGMLDGPARVETKLTSELLQANPGIERTSWEQGGVILLESWKQALQEHADSLRGITAGDLCDDRVKKEIAGLALAAALHRAGWKFEYDGAGSRMVFARDGKTLQPFQADCAELVKQCEVMGVAGLPLG